MAKNNELGKKLVIRTMKEDLARIRGQLGQLEAEKEKPTAPKKPPAALPKAPEKKPVLPKPTAKPEVKPPAPPPKPPEEKPAPPKPPTLPIIKPPEEKPAPPKPPEEKPAPPKPPKPKPTPPKLKPPTPKLPKLSRKTLMLAGVVIALVLVAGLVYWFLFAIPKLTPPPAVEVEEEEEKPLELTKPAPLIPVQRQIIIELEEGQDLATELKGEIGAEVPAGLSQILVYKDSLTPLSLEKVFEEFDLTVPKPLINNLGKVYTLLLFTQEEFLTATGTPSRLGFITEVKNTTVSSQTMKLWEETMARDLKEFYLAPRGKQVTEEFMDNIYKNVDIRYLNFPRRDITIDYALYSEENWLILTTSREFMYRIIDLLQ